MSTIEISYSLSLGSDLVPESGVDSALSKYRPTNTGNEIYGALVLIYGGEIVLDERYWDRLDLFLSRMFSAIRNAQPETAQVFELEDTHVECNVLLMHNDMIRVIIDERLVLDAPRPTWLNELRACARRLCHMFLRHDLAVPAHLVLIIDTEVRT
ncbi:MAG: hypothetical protein HUU55_22855 [Myxococcales bacterium]|nr:hypothetical protein [Myxococcales bacterium]